MHQSCVTSIFVLCFVIYAFGQQCDEIPEAARFDCDPDGAGGGTQEKCEARKCCWRLPKKEANMTKYTDEPGVPYCYYSSDFPTYEVVSNETTDFGQRLRLFRSQTTYLPLDIRNLTVDLVYETQQRFRIKIYDSYYNRYQVPLQVPVAEKKADMTDYNVVINSKPFSIIVTRKSTGVTL